MDTIESIINEINNIEKRIQYDSTELYHNNIVQSKPLIQQYKDILDIVRIHHERLINFCHAKNNNTLSLPTIYEEINASAPDIKYMNYIPPPKYDTLQELPPKYEESPPVYTKVIYNLDNVAVNKNNNVLSITEQITNYTKSKKNCIIS